MVYYAEKSYDLPEIDLLTLLFGTLTSLLLPYTEYPLTLVADSSETWSREHTILHAEAANPANAITKAQTRKLTKQVAHGLRENYGIGASGPGKDVVVVISSGQVLLPVLFYAVICAGGVYSAANTSATVPELARQVKQGGADLIACSEDTKDVAIAAAKVCGVSLDRVLVLESRPRSLKSVQGGLSCMSQQELDWTRITDPQELENSVICLLYSSGTTGVPKAVLLSHSNITSEALIPQYMCREWMLREATRKPTAPSFEYRTLAHLPAAHIAGCQGYFINPVVAGGPVYWMPKFDFPKFLEYNKKFRITTFFTVPPIYLLIAKSPLVTNQFESLVHAITGAAPMGKELQQLAAKKLGCYISQTWGLSETTGSCTAQPWDVNDETGSISPLLANASMRIVDEEDQDVEEGKPGELLMKGPMVTKGYFRNEKATSEAFTADGWFRTGDIGERRNGMFYIVDRKKVSQRRQCQRRQYLLVCLVNATHAWRS
jgi:4-coumarate--CoA ligase